MRQAIAILDSGVGGLTVAKEVMRQLPREKIIYFGDTARTPYGSRPPADVRRYTQQIVSYVSQFNPKVIVIACNTATAVALNDMTHQVDVPVIGVIHPGARAAVSATRIGKIGVIGTVGTIRSGAYPSALKQLSPNITVVSEACPLLVPLVEQGNFRSVQSRQTVKESLASIKQHSMDCLILGCTHYPFLIDLIQDEVGSHIKLISSAEETAREISTILYNEKTLCSGNDIPLHQFFCTGDPCMFQRIAQQWLGKQITHTPVVWQVSRL